MGSLITRLTLCCYQLCRTRQWASSHLLAGNYSSLVDKCTVISKKYRKKPYQRDGPAGLALWRGQGCSLKPTVPRDWGFHAVRDTRCRTARAEQRGGAEGGGTLPAPGAPDRPGEGWLRGNAAPLPLLLPQLRPGNGTPRPQSRLTGGKRPSQ